MSVVRVATRIAGERQVALHGAKYRPWAIAVGFGAVALVGALFAILDDDVALRAMMGALAVLFIVAAVVIVRLEETLAPRVIRFDQDAANLTFSAPAGSYAGYFLLAAAALLPGVLALLVGVPHEVPVRGLPLLVVSVAGAVWIGQQLGALRTPKGLALSERGLRGVRNSAAVDLDWAALAGTEVVERRGAKLHLLLHSGGVIVVDPRWTGSDPNVVSSVVDFYAAHPEHRAALADPRAALALVEESARAASD